MTDREKVIKALECRLDINHEKYKHCLSCQYRDDIDHLQWACMTDSILEDALSLLKAQEVPDTNVGKWVSVKDRLPESVANRVIVWVKDAEIYGHIGFGHYEKYKGQEIWFNLINNETFEIRGQTVTHHCVEDDGYEFDIFDDDVYWLGTRMENYCVGYNYCEAFGKHWYTVHHA